MAEQEQSQKVSFKDSLNLPQTDFPIRSNPAIEDPAMIQRWQSEDLYAKAFIHNQGNTKFILHDGPPYANGNLHLGHAYNNILKDIVTKSQRMQGKHVPVTPGWDCHGLPIEHKVSKENPGLSPQALKEKCRAYAQHWVGVQKEERKRLGVVMDWEHPYLTMNFDYEAAILRAFGIFLSQGYIERKNKTVPWCFSCETVLATAEIEYQDRKDPSIYVLFPLEQQATEKLFPALNGKTVNLVIWTTTPWTLPLNRAVMIKPGAQYVVLDINGTYAVVGAALADKVCAALEAEKKIVAEVAAEKFHAVAARAQHPFALNVTVPIVLEPNVMLDEGTACVHCAPGCGPEDYEVGVRNGLEIFSPISPSGTYTAEIQPQELVGMSVTDGQIWVIKQLAASGRLLYKNSIRHSYPHCWRCHNGLIFRATKQWFCDLSKGSLKEKTLAAADTIQTVPDKSINRLKATIEGRLEWCLSRQRVWGVPIPALLCSDCDATYITPELVERVAQAVGTQGIEYWDAATVEALLPKDFVCACGSKNMKKEQDILDVWFDSGISHYAVLKNNPKLAFPADMYLEGKDQHRGWFQSSLLTSMVINGEPCMRTILTHGFTVDKDGKKMSKSLGNVVLPQEMVDKLGTDGLRLWVSSIDCSGEAVVSEVLVKNVQEVLRKIRNTCRFLLSNLNDFDITKDAVASDKMSAIDQYALQELYTLNNTIVEKYNEYDFTAIFHILGDYAAVNLSAFYLDIIKDRLYVEKADGHARRSAQTACWYILDTLTKLMAPILSFNAEMISDHYQKNKTQSIHLQNFATLDVALAKSDDVLWAALKDIRSAILKAIEELRAQGIVKHSLDARVTVYFDLPAEQQAVFDAFAKQQGDQLDAFFKEFVIVSQFIVADSAAGLAQSNLVGLSIKVEPAHGVKCPRCWNLDESEHEHGLCARCQRVIG